MMGWSLFKLVYEAKSPIHIGWHTLGYIKLTRPYITGKNMWGAATTNLTQTYGEIGIEGYKKFGELLKKDVLLSYFFPSSEDKPLLPAFNKNSGLRYENTNFIKSFGQTAVAPETNTAEDETLHESEFIPPVGTPNGKPTCFEGYLFIREDASLYGKKVDWDGEGIALKPAIRDLFVGGDRKYGWGHLQLKEEDIQEINSNNSEMFGLSCKLGEDVPLLCMKNEDPLPGHLPINTQLQVKGDIEALSGREWSNDGDRIGAGQKISDATMCWMPGSRIIKKEEKKLELCICNFGMLNFKKP